MTEFQILRSPPISNDALNTLFSAAWPAHKPRDFQPVLARSLGYLCAWQADELVGFVNVAWDGGEHAFLLDPTVHPKARRRGLGTQLLKGAEAIAREQQVEWLHVDFEPALEPLFRAAGYRPTPAGLLKLDGKRRPLSGH